MDAVRTQFITDIFPLHTTFSLTDRYLQADLDEEIIFLDMESGEFLSLTGVARECWLLLCDGATVGTIIGRLCLIYEVERYECRAGVQSFLAELVSKHVVTAHRI
ncbi:MAG: PqqD family protein [Pseudomonadota bacterium]